MDIRNPTFFAAVAKGLLCACMAGVVAGCQDKKAPAEAPALKIKVGRVEARDLPIIKEFVGRTVGAVDADVRARVQGVLTGILFEEGKEVTEGQLLYTIDPAQYQAKVAAAKGQMAEAKTRFVQTEADLARIKPLADIDAVSKRDLDKAVAAKGVAEGAVEAAKAQLEAAEIELGYTKITSPTTGVIGISRAKVGELVGVPPKAVILNTVSKLDPIHVQFSVSEQEYLYFARLSQQAGPDQPKRSLEMILADGSVVPDRGEVVKLDRGVDVNSGAITVEASFPNPQKILRPGLFAKIRTVAETRSNVVLIPRTAIRELQGTFQVFVVDSAGHIEQRNIDVGPVSGDSQVVERGLSAGDVIALEGIQRLKSGMTIDPQISK
jgi:membrane fusion protein (multidrug efflux system)